MVDHKKLSVRPKSDQEFSHSLVAFTTDTLNKNPFTKSVNAENTVRVIDVFIEALI